MASRLDRWCHRQRFGALLLGLIWLPWIAWADSVMLPDVPQESLGRQASFLIEVSDSPLTLEQAMDLQRKGRFQRGQRPVLAFGIGARPVWMRLQLNNPTEGVLPFQLAVGATWIDQLDVHVVRNGRVEATWRTGDGQSRAFGLVPAMGFVFSPQFGPGTSELYLRAQTDDPLVLPIHLRSLEKANGVEESKFPLSYGFFYGYLAALVIYNALLFVGLRKRSNLYYALYLLVFIFINISYTGYGLAWLWPEAPEFQRHVIYVSLVVGCGCGLMFASSFLSLTREMPQVQRAVRWFILLGVGLLTASILAGNQAVTASVAFVWVVLFTLLMVALGVLAARHGNVAGRYFLGASLGGMIGASITPLAIWGWLPFTVWTYRATEIGVVVEASLFALALAQQIRQQDAARQNAEQMARTDVLTDLPNRRAFLESADPIWSTALRNNRPLSLVMLDIDFFKQINDRHGHEVGDLVLVEVAKLLKQGRRAGDILARWGGEEFVLLLPETSAEQALALAERLRESVARSQLADYRETLAFTASFGVAARVGHANLSELMNAADARLYEAKADGRNRVVGGA